MPILKSPLSKQSKFDKPIKWWKYKFVRNFFLYPIHTFSIVNGKNQSSNSFQWFSWMSTHCEHCEHCVTMLANCQIQWNERNSFILSVVALYSGKRKMLMDWDQTQRILKAKLFLLIPFSLHRSVSVIQHYYRKVSFCIFASFCLVFFPSLATFGIALPLINFLPLWVLITIDFIHEISTLAPICELQQWSCTFHLVEYSTIWDREGNYWDFFNAEFHQWNGVGGILSKFLSISTSED